jgi:glyoxylase-like metal-dependent hydrolase (beta-lactamase superfamily II)
MVTSYSLDSSYRVYPIRGLLGYCHLLHDSSRGEAVLIDTGLVGEMPLLSRVLRKIGLGWSSIKAVLLTHGHIDHTGHLFHVKQRTGAPVLAHPAEQAHINGPSLTAASAAFAGCLRPLDVGCFVTGLSTSMNLFMTACNCHTGEVSG